MKLAKIQEIASKEAKRNPIMAGRGWKVEEAEKLYRAGQIDREDIRDYIMADFN